MLLNEEIERQIPFHKPSIGQEEISAVVDTLRSGWLTTGKKTLRFEREFCHYVGCRHSVAVSSCTAGLHLALLASGVGEGDEVITTPYTFVSTAEAIIYTGATPIFVDIEEDGFNIDPNEIRKAITTRTKAIIAVHFAGQPCRIDELISIARANDLILIEDAAHALGGGFDGKKIGNIADLTVFSFYATKNISTGEGGMITTNVRPIADKLVSLRLHGMSRDAWKRYSSQGSWYYEIKSLGYKYNMTDIQASMGIHQLRKLEGFLKKREEIVKRYDEAFAEIPGISIPPVFKGRHARHLYVLRINVEDLTITRGEFIVQMAKLGIGCSVHFIPLHLQPFFADKYKLHPSDFPRAKKTYDEAVSIPLYPTLSDHDIERIIASVTSIILANVRRRNIVMSITQ